MTEQATVQGWSVTINVNGDDVLTIGHDHLSGIENIDDYGDVVRKCARHLLSFIGEVREEAEIEELIARLEKATGPDEDLDFAISQAISGTHIVRYSSAHRHYTGSVDDAMTMVPEEHAVSLEWSPRSPGHAWIYPPDNTDDISFEGHACRPAIALCIAAFKAWKGAK